MAARHTGDELQISKYVSVSVVYGTFARYGFTCLSLEGIDYHRAGYTFEVIRKHRTRRKGAFPVLSLSDFGPFAEESREPEPEREDRQEGKTGNGCAHGPALGSLSVPQPLTSLTTQLSLLSAAEPQ